MNEYEKMINGKLYSANTDILKKYHKECYKMLDKINNTKFGDFEKRAKLVKKLFEKVGENPIINKPFYCDYGKNISIGDNFYANYDCCFLDVAKITIGNNVLCAPCVKLLTAAHPIDKDVRNSGLEYGLPIVIKDNVWLGSGVIVNPGVTIGENSIIGSGSVVTKDIPSNVIACGVPCKVLRNITEEDKIDWLKLQEEYKK